MTYHHESELTEKDQMSKKGLEEFRKRVINEEIKRVHFMSKQRLKDL